MGKESELYDPYNTKTLGGTNKLDVETYENVQNNIHLEKTNRKLLELTDLIGRVTNNRSSSGPIPNTGQVTNLQVTGSGDDTYTLLQPGQGEVWEIQGGSAKTTNVVSVRYRIQIHDNNNSAVAEVADETVSANEILFDPSAFPLRIDQNLALKVIISGTSGSSIANVNLVLIRVR